jgi:hypothetical protein
MPKNKVIDLITDQEMAFARLVLSGTMTDRDAAQAVGLDSDTGAYTKSKPRVRAYMIEHRAERKPTHSLPTPQKNKKDRILSNFTKTDGDEGTACVLRRHPRRRLVEDNMSAAPMALRS